MGRKYGSCFGGRLGRRDILLVKEGDVSWHLGGHDDHEGHLCGSLDGVEYTDTDHGDESGPMDEIWAGCSCGWTDRKNKPPVRTR